jgi:hypothetical protein
MRDGGKARQPEDRRLLSKEGEEQVGEQGNNHSQSERCQKTFQRRTRCFLRVLSSELLPPPSTTRESCSLTSGLWYVAPRCRVSYGGGTPTSYCRSFAATEQLAENVLQDSAVLIVENLLRGIDPHSRFKIN